MNSSCLYAGPLNKALLVNHCCERMESSVLPLEFNGNTDRCIIQNAVSQSVQSNVSGAVDASASEVSIHECFRTTSMLRNRLRWMPYL
ncbi:hypothetical protein CK203_017732 [Vitis vinifera]|uniref:Uncharacterized protein n=1 Tax=Vitis vinifera TaxID=29760 RepID=A0A438JH70_VITVI|nr:hypothetical protein CK203_017732 [Vitis vinifera]